MSVAAVGAGVAAVGGAYLSSQGAKSAADAQAGAANAANMVSQAQYAQTRADNMPYMVNGVAGNNQLAYLLGLSTTPGTAMPSLANSQLIGANGEKNDYLYQNNADYRRVWDKQVANHYNSFGENWNAGSDLGAVDRTLRRVLAPQIAEAQKELDAQRAAAPNDPAYGSLNRKFSMSDLENDIPFQLGHEFAQEQGAQGINRQAAATGNMLSGATLKALTRFGANTANQFAGDARNRYVADQDSTYNRLAGLSSSGQTATSQVGSSGQNTSNMVSSNLVGVGNARGASAIAGANSFNNALGQGINAYQQNQLINSLGSIGGNGYGYNVNGAYSGQF